MYLCDWDARLTVQQRGGGFLRVDDPDPYSLPYGKVTIDGGYLYDISVFHALHCLSSIRGHLLLLETSFGRNNSNEIHRYLLDPQVGHVHHCFDYIRQNVMCNADLTLEWPRTESDGIRSAFDGWGIPHQCKDWVSSECW